MTPEQLQRIKADAEKALTELVDIVNHTPQLVGEFTPLMQSPSILADFQALSEQKPDVAEQLLRLTLATTVNYHSTVETTRQLSAHGQQVVELRVED